MRIHLLAAVVVGTVTLTLGLAGCGSGPRASHYAKPEVQTDLRNQAIVLLEAAV